MHAFLLLIFTLAVSAEAEPPERAYDSVLSLIERLYLRPERIDDQVLLQAAAERASDEIHWLVVEGDGDTVYLAHGGGAPIGSLTVGSMRTLPAALLDLEQMLQNSGYPLGDVPLRLTLMKGVTDGLDRYSRILADEAKARFDTRLKGTLVGIGATLRWQDSLLRVVSVLTGGPADLSGVRVGDVVQQIDGRSVATMPVSEATRQIRGEEGTQVVLSVVRGAGPVKDLALTRAEIIVPNVTHRVLDGQVGYVSIENVSQKTVHNLLVALEELKGLGALQHGLVLDLRGNTGGSMKESARAVDVFLEGGLLLRTVGRDGGRVQNLQERMVAGPGGQATDVPLVVVVDARTASGSEIMAGALVQLERAVLVGTRTYGKGSVQKLYPLDNGTDLKLTVAQYLLAGDREIDGIGLVPDTVVGRIEVDGDGVSYLGFDESWQRTSWDEIFPWVLLDPDIGGDSLPDLPVELARRAASASAGPTRADGLKALAEVTDALRVEEQGRLVAAMERLAVNWTKGVDLGNFQETDVRVVAEPWEGRRDMIRLRASVSNRDDEPLARVLVQLSCATESAWDGVVIPVGAVGPKQTVVGEVGLQLPPDIRPRIDRVDVVVRAEGRAPQRVGDALLTAQSLLYPDLRLAARLVDDQDGSWHAEVTVINDNDRALGDVEVRFGWPGDLDVEILDHAVRIPVVGPRGSGRADLRMVPGADAPPVLPLVVAVSSGGFGRLVRWPLDLPLDGRAVTLAAPRIGLNTPVTSAPVGTFHLPLSVVDDGRIKYVVVYAAGEKIAWSSGGRGGVALRPQLQLNPGVNTVHIEAGDDDGLISRARFAVYGEAPATVDAATDGEP
jgi:carboxyl-terminal processing protease